MSKLKCDYFSNKNDLIKIFRYRDDRDIKIMDHLRTAYEEKNEKELIRIVNSEKQKIFDVSLSVLWTKAQI